MNDYGNSGGAVVWLLVCVAIVIIVSIVFATKAIIAYC